MARGSVRKLSDKQRSRPWMARIAVPGVDGDPPKQRSRSFATRREAEDQLVAWREEIRLGTLARPDATSIASVARGWLEWYSDREDLAIKTYASYQGTIERDIVPALGEMQVQRLTKADVTRFYADLLRRGKGARTRQLAALRLCQIFDYAMDLDMVRINVARGVTAVRGYQPRAKIIWTAEQASAFRRASAESTYGPVWELALLGMRREEFCALRWADLDLAAGTATVRQTMVIVGGIRHIQSRTKTPRSARTVPFGPALVETLQRWRTTLAERQRALGDAWEANDLVTPNTLGRPIGNSQLVRDYDRWVAAAGVPRIRIHDIRATATSLLLAAGTPLHLVAEIIGDDPAVMLRHYARSSSGERRAAMEALEGLTSDPLAPTLAPDPDAAR